MKGPLEGGTMVTVPSGPPVDELVGITRRQALRKGAILGGALAWATPIVQVIGMKPAFAQVVSPFTELVAVRTGNVTRCFEVTQEESDCFAANCVGEPDELGCLNKCTETHGIGQLAAVDCPPG
jgi:hypothetical protein